MVQEELNTEKKIFFLVKKAAEKFMISLLTFSAYHKNFLKVHTACPTSFSFSSPGGKTDSCIFEH